MSTVIGNVACPFSHVCGNDQAEVKRDKSGNPYVFCVLCDPPSQHFSFGKPQRIKALGLEKFAGGAPAPEVKPAPEPAKKRGLLDDVFKA